MNMEISNTYVSELAALKTKKGRDDQGLFLVEGEKGVQELLAAGWVPRHLFVTEESAGRYAWAAEHGPEIIGQRQMQRLSAVHTPPNILAVAEQRHAKLQDLEGIALTACLDGVADPGNLGTILRTADWYGVRHVMLSDNGVDPYNEKVVRSAMGSLFRQNIVVSSDLAGDLERLKASGTLLLAADVHGASSALPTSRPLCLIMGSESHGIRPEALEQADCRYAIPGPAGAESLNVAVSFGIIMHMLAGGA